MSHAVPSKPPVRPFSPSYTLTTTTRVPGRASVPARPATAEDLASDQTAGPTS